MKFSEECREALKKVQRFDRVMYHKETQKIKDEIKKEIQRLEKVKNVNKEMRGKFYDT